MALGAPDARAQEDPHRVVHVVERHARVAVQVARGGVLPDPALRREHLVDERVPRLALGERLLDPLPPRLALYVLAEAVAVPQRVGPVVEGMTCVVIAAEQVVDELRPLVGHAGLQERHRLPIRGNAPRDVEVDATHELGVGRVGHRGDVVLPMALFDEAVDRRDRTEHRFPLRRIDRLRDDAESRPLVRGPLLVRRISPFLGGGVRAPCGRPLR